MGGGMCGDDGRYKCWGNCRYRVWGGPLCPVLSRRIRQKSDLNPACQLAKLLAKCSLASLISRGALLEMLALEIPEPSPCGLRLAKGHHGRMGI